MGNDSHKTKPQLIDELALVRQRLIALEAAVAGRDITKYKRITNESQKSEEKYSTILEKSNDAIIVLQDGLVKFANAKASEITGFSTEDVLGKSFMDFVAPQYRELVMERYRKRLAGEDVPGKYEIGLLNKDGSVISVEVNASLIEYDGKPATLSMVRDITERKRVEDALRESEARYRTLFETAAEGILIADIETKKLKYANPAICRMLGHGHEELTKMTVMDIHPRDSLEYVIAEFSALARGDKAQTTLPCMRKNGTIFYADIIAASAVIDGRNCNIGFFTDITEREHMANKLADSEVRYRRLIRVNKAFAAAFNTTPQKLIGKHCYELVHNTDKPPAYCPHGNTITRKIPSFTEQFEPNLNKWLHISTSPIFDEKGEVVATVHTTKDITEVKKMQEQLIMQDRLASIGQLVSGVAHELNNPLTSVIGFSDLLLQRELPDDIKADLKIVNDEAKRTSLIVKNLLTFARQQPQEKRAIGINEPIRTVLQLRSHEQSANNIKVNTHLAPDLPQIIGNSSQLQQVFFNIVTNAEQAMLEVHNKGTLTITTEQVGDIVRVRLNNDGPGISPENMKKLFTPFFTTKDIGKGTGLGLSICHGIITEHGGKIYAESGLGKGATFIVELPICKSPSTSSATNYQTL